MTIKACQVIYTVPFEEIRGLNDPSNCVSYIFKPEGICQNPPSLSGRNITNNNQTHQTNLVNFFLQNKAQFIQNIKENLSENDPVKIENLINDCCHLMSAKYEAIVDYQSVLEGFSLLTQHFRETRDRLDETVFSSTSTLTDQSQHRQNVKTNDVCIKLLKWLKEVYVIWQLQCIQREKTVEYLDFFKLIKDELEAVDRVFLVDQKIAILEALLNDEELTKELLNKAFTYKNCGLKGDRSLEQFDSSETNGIWENFSELSSLEYVQKNLQSLMESVLTLPFGYDDYIKQKMDGHIEAIISHKKSGRQERTCLSLEENREQMKKKMEKSVNDFCEEQWQEKINYIKQRDWDAANQEHIYFLKNLQDYVEACLEKPLFINPLTLSKTCVESVQGPREDMQDDHTCFEVSGGTILGVFDGHSYEGDRVSNYIKRYVEDNFERILLACNEDIMIALQETLDEAHDELHDYYIARSKNEKLHIDELHREIDLDHQQDKNGLPKGIGGSTAVLSFIKEGVIYTATLGDSRAFVYRKIDGKWASIPLSPLHDWASPEDAKRAEQDGEKKFRSKGWTTNKAERRYGGINVSRTIGNFDLHPPMTTKAEGTIFPLQPGDYVVSACDGLFDFTNEDERLEVAGNASIASDLVTSLKDKALSNMKELGWGDNITIVGLQVLK